MKEWRKNHPEQLSIYNKKHTNKSHRISQKEWDCCKGYFKNQDGESCCAYCALTERENKERYNQQLHKEHVIHSGKDNLTNCVPSCKICNSEKHTASLNSWYNKSNHSYSRERYLKIYQWIRWDCKKYITKKRPKQKNGKKPF